MNRLAWLAVLLGLCGCQARPAVLGPVGSAPSARTALAIQAVQDRWPKARGWFALVSTLEHERDAEGRIVPLFGTIRDAHVWPHDAAGQSLRPAFAPRFGAATRIASALSPGVWIDVTPAGTFADVAAEVYRGLVVYRDAFAATDVFYKATPTHVDEYLYLRDPSAPTAWRYRVVPGPDVQAVREAPNLVEVVDRDGHPRLRAARPYAVDANGMRRDGTIRLVGGEIVASIDPVGLTYPLLVDPDWTATGEMFHGRFYHSVGALLDGTVITAGGCTLSRCSGNLGIATCRDVVAPAEILDPATRLWTRVGAMSVGRMFAASAMLPDGRFLMAGGCTSVGCEIVSPTADAYDPAMQAFAPTGPLAEARAGSAAAVLADGRVLVAGGCTLSGCTTRSEIYDPASGLFVPAAPLAVARGRAAVAVLSDGRVLVAGGCTTIGCTAPPGLLEAVLSSAEVYDPLTDRWTATSPMAVARGGHAAAPLVGGDALVVGGCTDPLCTSPLATAEILVGASLEFVPASPMTAARFGVAAVPMPMPDGTVLVSQGCSAPNACDVSAEIYDPLANSWTRTGNASRPRAFHALLYVPGWDVVVANGGCDLATCLIWTDTYPASPLPDGGMDGGLDGGPGRVVDPSCECRGSPGAAAGPQWIPAALFMLALALGLRARRRR